MVRALSGLHFGRRVAKATVDFNGIDNDGQNETNQGIAAQARQFTRPGPDFEEFDPSIRSTGQPKAKLIAFYLPQFHLIPENDNWWGRGFTEWTTLARGLPRFIGHYQPRIPRDLGYYSLDDVQPITRQAEYASQAGIHGFCFYHYWFNGKTLLQKPIDLFIGEKSIPLNFCVMWANHDWTRAWTGKPDEILMAHDYEALDDNEFVEHFAALFRSEKYMRIGGRPLFFIYHPKLIPNARQRISRWRDLFRRRHDEQPLIFMSQVGSLDPSEFGLDGAMEFPPHKSRKDSQIPVEKLQLLDMSFQGSVQPYESFARQYINEPAPDFPLIKAACTGWDNDPRRPASGLVLYDATPSKYETWLRRCIEFAQEHPVYGENLVAVNAWNEWTEGAYLEPDIYYGSAYLNATARALRRPD